MLEEIEMIIFWPVALTIFGSNLTIAVAFQRKDKKSPSDYLIITGLVGDAVYGLVLLLFPVINAPLITFPVRVAIFIQLLTIYLDSTLSLFSLLIIFFLTLNRYVAIVKPFLYKSYFKKTTVLAIITSIITVCVLFFIASSAYPFLILFSYDGKEPPNLYFIQNLSLWPQVQFLLVLIDSSLMAYVYGSVAKKYNISLTTICCPVPRNSKANRSTAANSRGAQQNNLYQG